MCSNGGDGASAKARCESATRGMITSGAEMPDGDDQTFEVALAYDGAFVPRYAWRFGERLLGALRLGSRPSVLDLACRTGYPSSGVMERARDGRVIALDRDAKFLELARSRMGADVGRRVFLKQGGATELRFGAEVFSHVICNLLDRVSVDRAAVLSEARRVLIPGGQMVFTAALQGSFIEVVDMLREVATRRDLARLAERVEQYASTFPTIDRLRDEMVSQGFASVTVDAWEFTLDYPDAQALFADPVAQHAGISDWRWCAEAAPDADAVLAAVRVAFDTYFRGLGFSITVVGGVVSGYKPE